MIIVNEVLQAGDVFMMRFECPECAAETLEGFPLKFCSMCKRDFSDLPMALKNSKKRLLAGSFRKQKGGLSKQKIRSMYEIQNGLCAYCSTELKTEYEVEHVLPIAAGGTNGIHNLVLSCQPCNRSAGSLVFNNFHAKQIYVLNQKKMNTVGGK